MKIAIIGMGTVGQAQAYWLRAHDLTAWDVAWDEPYPAEILAACDFAIVTVGTPAGPDGAADITQVQAAVAALPAELPVMIRSTVPPGTTDALADSRPGPVVFVPEYLYEGHYAADEGRWHEVADVPWMLLGGSLAARVAFRPWLGELYPGQIRECPAVVAELAKYTANLYWATRVTFVTELARIAARFGVDWDELRAAWLMDPRVHPIHTAMTGHGPGFGGKCWPKDLTALILAASAAGYEAWFLDDVRLANERYRG